MSLEKLVAFIDRQTENVESLYLWTSGFTRTAKRISRDDRFREVFPDSQVAYIGGDREFIGWEWLTDLMTIADNSLPNQD